MNTEPVRTNGRIVAAVVTAIVGSVAALRVTLVSLMTALGVEQSIADATGDLAQIGITIAGTTVAVLKGAEITRRNTTAWDPIEGAYAKDGIVEQPEQTVGYIGDDGAVG